MVNDQVVTTTTTNQVVLSNVNNGDVVKCRVSNVFCGPLVSNSISVSGISVSANAGADRNVCQGTTTTLGASSSAGYTYSWNPETRLNDPAISDPVFTPDPNNLGTAVTYTLTVTNSADGCSAEDVVTLTTHAWPDAPTVTDFPTGVCVGNTASFTVDRSAGFTYSYETPFTSGRVSIPSGTGAHTVSGLEVGTGTASYIDMYVVDNTTQCERMTSTQFPVNPLPVVSGFAPTVYTCKGGTYPFSVDNHSGSTYNWSVNNGASVSSGQGTSQVNITFPNVGTPVDITIIETSAEGCVSEPYVWNAQSFDPTITIGNDVSICAGESTTLDGSNSLGTYDWITNPAGEVNNMSFYNGPGKPTVIPTQTTVYTLNASVYGCPASASVTVTVKPMPTSQFSTTPLFFCDNATNAGISRSSTPNSTRTVFPVGINRPTPGGTGGPGYVVDFMVFDPVATSTTYNVIGQTILNGCTTSVNIPVTVSPVPVITSTTPAARCGAGTLALSATSNTGTVEWYAASTGGTPLATGTSFTTPSISSTTTYYAAVNNNGCFSARTAVVATVGTVIPTITSSTGGSRCYQGQVYISATASGGGTLHWYTTSTGGTSVGTGSPFAAQGVLWTTTYYVEARLNGCTSTTRTPVVAAVRAVPDITTTSSTICEGGFATLRAGSSLQFNGTNTAVVNVPNSATLNPCNAITVSGWVQTTSNGKYIVTKNDNSFYLGVGITSSGRAEFYLQGVSNLSWLVGTTAINDGNWHHVVGTYDAAGGTNNLRIYVDGVLQNSRTASGNIVCNGTSNVQIGARNPAGVYMNGILDDVGLWNRALTQTEIVSLRDYSLTGLSSGLLAYWRMEEGTGTTVADVSGNNNNGTMSAGVTWTNPGTYSWSPGGFTTNPVMVSQGSTTTYTATMTSNGCTRTASPTLTVVPMPNSVVNASGPLTFCEGGSVTLTSANTTTATYQWFKDGVAIPFATTPSLSPSTSGSYTLQLANTPCMITSSAKVVTINPLPVDFNFTATPNPICQGATLTMNLYTPQSGSGVTYTGPTYPASTVYLGGGGGPTGFGHSVQINESAGFTLTGTATVTATGCQRIKTIPLTVNPKPAFIPDITTNTYNCGTNQYNLGAASPVGGTYNFKWYDYAVPLYNASTATSVGTGQTFNPTIGTKTLYAVNLQDPATGCYSDIAIAYVQNKCKALQFDGVDDVVTLASPANNLLVPGSNGFTYEVFFAADAGGGSDQILFTNRSSSTTGVTVGLLNGRPYVKFNSTTYGGVTGSDLRNGVCHHLIIRRTASPSNDLTIYLDGVTYYTTSGVTAASLNNTLTFGKASNGTASPYKGKIDEVRIWSADMDPTWLGTVSNVSVIALPNLAAVWMFIETNDQLVRDNKYGASGTNNAAYGTNITVESTDPVTAAYTCATYLRAEEEAQTENVEAGLNISVIPNPFDGEGMLNVSGAEADHVSIVITDVTGRIVYENKSFPNNSNMKIGEGLSAEMHFVQIIDGENVKQLKFIKVK